MKFNVEGDVPLSDNDNSSEALMESDGCRSLVDDFLLLFLVV
jgi:hypothetical protein